MDEGNGFKCNAYYIFVNRTLSRLAIECNTVVGRAYVFPLANEIVAKRNAYLCNNSSELSHVCIYCDASLQQISNYFDHIRVIKWLRAANGDTGTPMNWSQHTVNVLTTFSAFHIVFLFLSRHIKFQTIRMRIIHRSLAVHQSVHSTKACICACAVVYTKLMVDTQSSTNFIDWRHTVSTQSDVCVCVCGTVHQQYKVIRVDRVLDITSNLPKTNFVNFSIVCATSTVSSTESVWWILFICTSTPHRRL